MRVLTTLAVLVSLSAMGQPARQARAIPSAGVVKVDGVLDEPCWQQGKWQTDFMLADVNAKLARAAVQTRFKVAYTASAAYVAVECDEPNMAGLKAKTPWRDGAVWSDDCVEIFFDPSNTGRYYHQILANSRGAIFDMYAADFGKVKSKLWDGAFTAAGSVDREAGVWRLEVEIPYGTLVLGSEAGSNWRINVARERHATGALELTTWSRLQGNFHQPLLFGSVSGMPDDYRAFRLRTGEPKVGISRAASGRTELSVAMSLTNETGKDRQVSATLTVPGTDLSVAHPPVALAVGKQAQFAFPTVTVKKGVDKTNVVLTFSEGGMPLRKLYKRLSCEFRPLSVTMLQPVYRDCIFPDEEIAELVFQVSTTPELAQGAASVGCEFRDRQGTVLARQKHKVAELPEQWRLPCAGLAMGTYALRVTALDRAGKALASVERTIKKLPKPAAGSMVRVDENRNLLVDGRPFLGIGWYGGIPADPRPDVVAMQNVIVPHVLRYPDPSAISQQLAHGVYTIVSVENGRLFHSFNMWQKQNEHLKPVTKELHTLAEPSPMMRDLVGKLVAAVRNEPGLLGYYISDEPEIHDIRSEYLESFYQLLRELDPYHPVFVTNDTVDGLVTHGYKCADVLSPDPYSKSLDYIPRFLKKIQEIALPGQTWWVTPWHSASDTHFKRPMGSARAYPYRVQRSQVMSSLCYGAKGFTGYTSAFYAPEIEYRYGLPHIWRELRALEPFLAAPVELAEVSGASDVPVLVRQTQGRVLVLASNHGEEPRTFTVSWPALGSRQLRDISTGRSHAARGGEVKLTMAAGEVAALTDAPVAAFLPSVATVEKELARRHAAARKPGNLLHWSRGVRAACSKGHYAPWFDQFFYYAINGVTDDRGWYVSHAKGKPAWFEVTLPKETNLGRVEIYTENLRDYRLEIADGQGNRRQVAFKGNGEKHLLHGFDPPIPCLKLRLHVTATTNGDGVVVHEIEAYEARGNAPPAMLEGAVVRPVRAGAVFFAAKPAKPYLWEETFRDFATNPKFYWDKRDTKWVTNPETYLGEPVAKGLRTASRSPKGYAGMTRFFPYDPAFRFFQVEITDIEGKGYRYASVFASDGSGKLKVRGGINTSRPGIYTVDAHYLHESFRTVGARSKMYVRVGSAGSSKQDDGTVLPGPAVTYGWLRLAAWPRNGLVVTLADGSPLPRILKQGDTLHFEVHLDEPATDVTAEAMTGPSYKPLSFNAEPYVQLAKADTEGRVWAADLTLGKGTGTFKCGGYPAVFRANVLGGALEQTHFSSSVSFE